MFSRRCGLIFSFGCGCQRARGLLALHPPPWALHRARCVLTLRPQQHLLRLLLRRLLRRLRRRRLRGLQQRLRRLLLLRLRKQR